MSTTLLERYFETIAQRFRKENDLSDITWALCITSIKFKICFLSYFFGEGDDYSQFDVKREFALNISRPDFYFINGDKEFIIENKIYDKNLHNQYLVDFPKAKYGLIANYKINIKTDFTIKTWKDFKNYLEVKLKENDYFDEETKPLIKGYIKYLKNVCNMIDINEKMNFDNLKSVNYFNLLLEQIIDLNDENIQIEVDNQTKGTSNYRTGKYFDMRKPGGDKHILPWFGICYRDPIPFWLEFNPNACSYVHKSFDVVNATMGNYYNKPDNDGEAIWFNMNEKTYEDFKKASTVDEQINILQSFFKEVISLISKFL